MLEAMLVGKAKKVNKLLSFQGEVASGDFITGTQLSTALGLTAGQPIAANDAAGWLKFYYNNKLLYIAKKQLRYALSWQDIYLAGAANGDNTTGVYPGATPKLQNAKVTINGSNYIVRLLRFSPVNPATSMTIASEAKDLLLGSISSPAGGGALAKYSPAELGFIPGAQGSNLWCLEASDWAKDGSHYLAYLSDNRFIVDMSSQSRSNVMGWRPVLELIE